MTHIVLRAKRLRLRVAVFVLIVFVGLAADQLTKWWALNALAGGKKVEIVPSLLSFCLVRNPGASLGLGSSVTWVLAILAGVACLGILVAVFRTVSWGWTIALSLAFAGAFGNLIDRVAYAEGFLNGKVVDFINYGWSVGNVADLELMVAGILVIVLVLRGKTMFPASQSAAPSSTESQNQCTR